MKSNFRRVALLFLVASCFLTEEILAAPGAFTLISAIASCNGSSPQITLNWTTSSGVVTYDLYRGGILLMADIPPLGRSFPDTGANISPGVTYTYFLRAKNADGTTDSGELQATSPANCSPDLLPADFILVSATASCNVNTPQVALTWTTSVGATNYDVYRNGSLLFSGIPPSGRSHFDSGGTPGVSYAYTIRARNSDGNRDSGSLQATVPTNCGGSPGPGAFSLTSATPVCINGGPRITLTWTASSGAATYDVYRDGAVVSAGVSATTPSFVNTGSTVRADVRYAYFVRANNAVGTRDSGPLVATASGNCAPASFTLTNRGGVSLTSPGGSELLSVGWGRIQTSTGSTTPSGLAIFGLRQNNVLVTEAAVAGSPAIQSGRIYAEIGGSVNTGVAIANPNDQPATVSFFFTDQNGNFGSDSTTIPANGQLARFLDQAPYNGRTSFDGTFTFNSTVPVSVIALRGLTNERGEFLITTLPVADLSVAASQNTLQFSHYADGGGWTTQVILVNPSDVELTGAVQFRDPSGLNATLIINGEAGSSATYRIPARSSQKLRTSGASASVLSGSVRVVPAIGSSSPSGLVLFSFKTGGITVAEAGVPDVPASTSYRLYAEASGDSSQSGSIQTGVAAANLSAAPATVSFELNRLDGSSTGLTGTVTIPPNGQTAMFLNQIQGFGSLPVPFRGVLRASSTSSISMLGLRGRYNERNDFLIATTLPINETAPASTSPLFFPHFADSGGYSTQFILFSGVAGQTSSGSLQLFSNSGQTLSLSLQN